MSALIHINQGEPDGSADRSTKRTYRFWNTDLDDETLLINQAFVPLTRNLSSLPPPLENRIINIMEVFFEKGTFLRENDVMTINEALQIINRHPVTLTNNGVYYQPVIAGKKSPDNLAWRLNGQSRLAEFEVALDQAISSDEPLFDFK